MPDTNLTYQQLYDLLIDQIGSAMGRHPLDALLLAERLRCARAICTRCAYGDIPQSVDWDGFGSVMFAHTGNFVCDASNIWALGVNHGPV